MKENNPNSLQRFFNRKKCSRKIIKNGKNITFLNNADVVLTDGASRESIVIGDNAINDGTLWAMAQGTIKIDEGVSIGEKSIICATSMVSIGANTKVGHHTSIIDHHTQEETQRNELGSYAEAIIIGKNCTIGNNVVIGKGVVIADGSTIPDNTIMEDVKSSM